MTPSARTPSPRLDLFGIRFDALRLNEAVERIHEWFDHPAIETRYVVTPNVDHAVRLRSDADFRDTYRHAAMVVADGKPLVLASRLLGRPLPGAVPGSDLVPALFDRTGRAGPLRVFLLGAAPGVAQQAAHRIRMRWPHVHVVGTESPPLGFQHDDAYVDRLIDDVNRSEPHLLVVGLGAPKQEFWVSRHRARLRVPVTICAGATIDFLAEHKRRAPVWMRRLCLEWLHRMLTEPGRLGPRYMTDAIVFPRLLVAQLWSQLRGTAGIPVGPR